MDRRQLADHLLTWTSAGRESPASVLAGQLFRLHGCCVDPRQMIELNEHGQTEASNGLDKPDRPGHGWRDPYRRCSCGLGLDPEPWTKATAQTRKEVAHLKPAHQSQDRQLLTRDQPGHGQIICVQRPPVFPDPRQRPAPALRARWPCRPAAVRQCGTPPARSVTGRSGISAAATGSR